MLLERFHLNGHTIGFCTRTQKVEPPYYKTRPFTVGVEELNLTLVHSAGKEENFHFFCFHAPVSQHLKPVVVSQ